MNYFHNDDHNEDDLPVISLANGSSSTRRIFNDSDDQDDTDNDHSTRLIGNWQNLYETSVHSLQSHDEDQRFTAPKSFYLDQQPIMEKPRTKEKLVHCQQSSSDEIPSFPIYQPQIDLSTNKSRWQIRLPELLNSTVGPDRQKRDITRRHTTNVVFQQSNTQNNEFNAHLSNIAENDRPISPIVKQLKQKFDRMTASSTPSDSPRTLPQFSFGARPKLNRVASLTSRGLTANTGERLIRTSRSGLPVRPSPDEITVKPRTASTDSSNSRTPFTNDRAHRVRASPPVSYPKHFYPPLSTTSVVKQLIGGGATLVYDSIGQPRTSKTTSTPSKHQRSIEQRTKDLIDTNSNITGRQLPSDTSSNAYATIKHETSSDKREPMKRRDSESEEIYYESMSRRSSDDLSEVKSNQAPSIEPRNSDTNPNKHEPENYYPIYDMTD